MTMSLVSLLRLAALVAVLFSGASAFAGDDPGQVSAKSRLDGLLGLMGTVNGLQIPDLTGLIQPEKMGMLTDNQTRICNNRASIRDNQAHLLSDNETEVDLLSGNQVRFLSGIRLFSGITVHVHVSVHDGDARSSKAKKDDLSRDSKKSKKRKAGKKTLKPQQNE